MLNRILENVKNMPSEFRAAPFWAWNTKLSPEELRRQIKIFDEMGLGGFFMHVRVGLNTPYLSDEFFECINACADEAEKRNMRAWLYDEDRWPSGAAGGLVTKNKEYRLRFLTTDEIGIGEQIPAYPDSLFLGLFAITLSDDEKTMKSYRKIESETDRNEGETVYAFQRTITQPSSWFNDQTYLDTLNPEATAEFIRVTHEKYKKECKQYFGKTVPGIFMDEPNFFHGGNAKKQMAWTDRIPVVMKEQFGSDILARLPELLYRFEGETISPLYREYMNVTTDLFVKSFAKPIYDFCEQNGIESTGHVLQEDTVYAQMMQVGATMRFYEYMHAPGIDLLTEYSMIYDTAKQCTSMAHQFGRRWRLSETYGCTGWNFPFSGHKALGDWQYALGINLRCPHLAWYSMEGEAKRDYPASISFQSSWYKQLPMVENYFARLGAALSEGEEQRDLLVIHPEESTWSVTPLKDRHFTGRCPWDVEFIEMRNQLLIHHLDFDYGDEEVMSRHCVVENGKLRIAKASYKAVLIPHMAQIRGTTLAFLRAFAANGGHVFYMGEVPAYVDGKRSTEAAETYKAFTFVTQENMVERMSPAARRVSVTGEDGNEIEPVLYLLRKGDDFQTLFLCNTGMKSNNYNGGMQIRYRNLVYPVATVTVNDVRGRIYELNLKTGEIYYADGEVVDGKATIRTSFSEIESRLFFITENELPAKERPLFPASVKSQKLPADGWKIQRDEPNVLVLDQCSYSINGGEYEPKTFILEVDQALRKALGVRGRGGQMVQPWLTSAQAIPENQLDIVLRYDFTCNALPSGALYLALERPDLYTIKVNGVLLEQHDVSWWVDPSLRRLELPAAMLKEGENVIELAGKYHELLPGLESMFLLGEFGVEKNTDTLTELSATFSCGDVCDAGLPNYSGSLTYTRNFRAEKGKRTFIKVNNWEGTAFGVSVNGSKLIPVGWAPYEVEVTDFIRDGENELEINIFGSRRNSHGPFYLHDGEISPGWCGPAQMSCFAHPDKILAPLGLLDEPEILVEA